jgi:hypothetical protein
MEELICAFCWLFFSSLKNARSKKQNNYVVFLGAIAKLRKVTISFAMSVRPFVRMEHFGFHWMDFHEI